jgi:hypothetical protein
LESAGTGLNLANLCECEVENSTPRRPVLWIGNWLTEVTGAVFVSCKLLVDFVKRSFPTAFGQRQRGCIHIR